MNREKSAEAVGYAVDLFAEAMWKGIIDNDGDLSATQAAANDMLRMSADYLVHKHKEKFDEQLDMLCVAACGNYRAKDKLNCEDCTPNTI